MTRSRVLSTGFGKGHHAADVDSGTICETLFDAFDQALAIADVAFDAAGTAADYRFIKVNAAFEHQMLSEPHGLDWLAHLGRVATTGEPQRIELGEPIGNRQYEVELFRIGEPDARQVGVLLRDVSDRRQMETALSESDARIQLAMGATRMATWEWLPVEDRVTVSDSFASLYGLPAIRGAEQGFALVVPEDRAHHFAKVRRIAADGGSYTSEFRIRRPDGGGVVWLEERAEAQCDADGRVARVIGITFDVTERKLAEAALRDSQMRLRQFGEASQDVLWIRDAEKMQWEYLTPAFETIYGLPLAEALSGDNYRSWLELVVPEDRPRATDAMRRVRTGQHVTFEYRVKRPRDGAVRWLRNTDFPITDAAGKVVLIGGIGEDVTDAKLNQERLERSEERLRSAAEVGRLGLWDWDVRTGEVHWSDEHFRMEGYAVGEVSPSYETWTQRIHPEDRAATEEALRHAMAAKAEYVREFRVVHPDGSVHWLAGRGRFFYDDDGAPVRMIGAMVDTTDQRVLQQRLELLVAELQHRTRNLIAVVRSVADKTIRRADNLAHFRESFCDRLDALARVQGLLSRLDEYERVSFDELIRSELDAAGAIDDAAGRVTLEGPDGVRLRSSTVQTLAMALHELMTNAAKYGALSQAGGHLAIAWSVKDRAEDGRPWLHIDWRESGVTMPATELAPRGTGQGRELIERALPYQLKAETGYKLESDGVHCTIRIPISATLNARSDQNG